MDFQKELPEGFLGATPVGFLDGSTGGFPEKVLEYFKSKHLKDSNNVVEDSQKEHLEDNQ